MAGLAATMLAASQAPASAAVKEFDDMTVAELEAAMEAGTLTAEKLVQLCLDRIKAYDDQGPKLNVVMALNPNALAEAKALDAERKAKGPRSGIHGMPVILKDNFDTVQMPTTGGSVLLEGSIPPDDAYTVRKLRDAGAIILAKVNLSEFAGGGGYSSLGGQTKNPHDLARGPAGSSGGSGAGIAAGYAPLGMGSDTSGSIRGPAAANGVVALKPTTGLLSRGGIIPLSLTFDTGGPYARNVSDIAVMLGLMTGVDPEDPRTNLQVGKAEADYTKFLDPNALKGARIGVARQFVNNANPDVKWAFEAAVNKMKAAGAVIVDISYPQWFLEGREEWYTTVRWPEFGPQLATYLATLKPGYPKTLEEMIAKGEAFNAPRPDGAGPNTARWTLMKNELASGSMDSWRYRAVKEQIIPAITEVVDGVIADNKLDAIIYPTSGSPAGLIAGESQQRARSGPSIGGATNIANFTGYPDLIVPMGFTGGANLPVTLSFFGPAFSEGKLISLGYSFEQLTKARRRPVNTPALKGAAITVK